MSEWCYNRFEITGKSVCMDVLSQWINGEDPPHYRHAILHSIQLFLAGYSGLLKPARAVSYPPCQGLVQHGTGQPVIASLAFEQWLELLKKDVVLDAEQIRTIDRLYHQSGLGALKWGNIPQASRSIMSDLIKRQYADWFGLARLTGEPDAGECWQRLQQYPERAPLCDMLMVIPTRLATELSGNSGLLAGIPAAATLYRQVYGSEWPAGHNVAWQRHSSNGLTLHLDSPWYPPSGELVAAVSRLFECEIRHSYSEPVSGISGYNCYDQGEHVDGYQGSRPDTPATVPALYLVSNGSSSAAQETAVYAEVRG